MIAKVVGDAGQGPPLVYVPGVDGTGEMLFGLAARLEQSVRLVRIGYDVAGPASPGESYTTLARDVDRLLASLGLRPVTILAESFGVALALTLALEHPERVSGLLLVNGFPHYTDRFRLGLARSFMPFVPGSVIRTSRRLFAPHTLFGPRRDPAALAAFRAFEDEHFGDPFLRRLDMIKKVDLRPRLGEVRCPVAIYASDSDLIVPSVPSARVMAAGLPDATLTILERAGHVVLPLEAEPWIERTRELFERVGQSSS